MTRTDKVASHQPVFSTPLFAEFDLGLLDPVGHVTPLDVASMVETRKEPAWTDSTTDPRSLAIFLQRNVEGERVCDAKKQLICRLEGEMRRPGADSKIRIPGLDLEFRDLFAGSLCPIYNDVIVVVGSTAYLATLLERRIRQVVVSGSGKCCVPDLDTDGDRLVIGITVNVRRAVLCDGLSGYLRAVMDAGRMCDRIERQSKIDGELARCGDDVVHTLNSAFGFSGHYYSVLTVMTGETE